MTTDPPKPEPTADYRPADERAGWHPLPAVPGGGPATDDLPALLRRRLLFVAAVFAAYYAVIVAIVLIDLPTRDGKPGFIPFLWLNVAAVLVSVGTAGLLAGRVRLSVPQLRVCELALFGVLFGWALYREYMFLWLRGGLSQAAALLEAGQREPAEARLNGLCFEANFVWAVYTVAYGVLVPNTWRRCAAAVAIFTLVPAVVWVAGCAANGLPPEAWFLNRVKGAFLLLGVAAALAVYGSHRIATLQGEARAARRLGQYVLREKLGAGGMGEVYRADHLLLRRPCAVKLIRPDRAGDPGLLRRFEREVQATATLTHPNAVQVFDYGRTPDGTLYYVMEYLPGLTLDELVRRDGPLPPARAVHLLRQLCGALREAHAIGLIHRDLKPGNVVVCTRGGQPDTAKLLDFGLVRPLGGADGERLTGDGVVAGTPAYMSPEQAGGRDDLDARSDVYSLGAVAYFLLAGRSPFAGRSPVRVLAAHLYEPAPPLTAHRPDVPPELAAVVARCLAKAPADRFSDMRGLEAALAGCPGVGPWTEADATRAAVGFPDAPAG